MEQTVYQIQPKILHEYLDNEVVVINLDTGTYFSLNPIASQIWNSIQQNQSIESICKSMAVKYQKDAEYMTQLVRTFAQELEEHKLIYREFSRMQTEGMELLECEVEEKHFDTHLTEQTVIEFVAPKLEVCTDMQDMLLLDPIHDVSEATGWPNLKTT